MNFTGQLWTQASIWICVAAVIARWAVQLVAPQKIGGQRLARAFWTLGYCALVAHIACAFAVYHDWSHDQAYRHTAQRTEQMIGRNGGGGLWVNYFFALVWAGDLLYWWRGLDRYRQRWRAVNMAIQGLFVFMIFQAAVVFAAGPIRWLTLAGFAGLAALAVRRRRSRA